MKLHSVEFVLVIIGGINWGLMGIGGFIGADWNVIHMILGSWPAVEWIVYVLVGLSAIGLAMSHKNDCRHCNPGGAM